VIERASISDEITQGAYMILLAFVLTLASAPLAQADTAVYIFDCVDYYKRDLHVKAIHTTDSGSTSVSDWIKVQAYDSSSECQAKANQLNSK
jgi:hypothetical protein